MAYKVPGNFVIDSLQEAINNDQTTLVLNGSYQTPSIIVVTRSFKLNDMLESEVILLNNKVGDTYTVTRDYDGRGSRSHDQNEKVLFNITAEHYDSLLTDVENFDEYLLLALNRNLSITSGVVRTSLGDYEVIPTVTPSLSVRVSDGYSIVNSVLNKKESVETIEIGAPSSQQRISLVYVNEDGSISVKHGSSSSTPSPPAPEANTLSLATILVDSTDTEIVSSAITDVRVYFGNTMYFDSLYINDLEIIANATIGGTVIADAINVDTVTANSYGHIVANSVTSDAYYGNIDLNLGDLTDVNIPEPTNGQVLKYLDGLWISDDSETFSYLDDLEDVQIASAQNGHILIFDTAQFTNKNITGDLSIDKDGVTSYTGNLGNIPDVILTAPVNNQILIYDAGEWKNYTFDLEDLDSVDLTSPTSGHILLHDGISWKNLTLTGHGSIDGTGELTIDTFDGDNPGLVPTGDTEQELFLCVDGQWKVPSIGVITGPGTSTDKAIAIWDGTTGQSIMNSLILTTETGGIVIPGTITVGTANHILTNAAGLIDGGKIQNNSINSTKLTLSGVVAGSYTATNITVDAAGRVTSASNGLVTLESLSDGPENYEVGKFLMSTFDGWEWIDLPLMGPDEGSGGSAGLVPAPAVGGAAAGEFLGAGGWAVPEGSGNVSGPASSTQHAVALYNDTTGQALKNSSITSTNGSDLIIPGSITAGSSSHLLTSSVGLIDGAKIQVGSIPFDRVDGVDLNDLDDVSIVTPQNGNVLTYDNGDWVAAEPTGGGGGSSTFVGLTDTPANYTDQASKFVKVNGAGDALEFVADSGAENFTELNDTPSSLSGEDGKVVAVNTGGTALEFITAPSGGSAGPDLLCPIKPRDTFPLGTTFAGLITRGVIPVLVFDKTTAWSIGALDTVPSRYGGDGFRVEIHFSATPTTGNVQFDLAFRKISGEVFDIDTLTFAAAQSSGAVVVPVTSGNIKTATINFTNAQIDGLDANDLFLLSLTRNISVSGNTDGNVQVFAINIFERTI